MAHKTPQFNIKTGSDSSLFFSREVTGSDVAAKEFNEDRLGLIKNEDTEESDYYQYPVLTRRTGHSIKGTTETIESQELRKGRTKSAPRKGNSSSEGSLDIELSPETYDNIFEAALRNKWTPWTSDANSPIKFDFSETLEDGQFISNGKDEDGGLHAKYLIGVKGDADTGDAVILFDSKADLDKYEIDELTCGTEDIKYSALAQYGGISGEDLYQEFEHLAVNTMSLSVTPGQIVTGSFGFMGSNNPDLLGTGEPFTKADPQPSEAEFNAGTFYVEDSTETAGYVKADTYDASETYYIAPTDLINHLAYKDDEDEGRFVDQKNAADVKTWIENLADKTGTSTDQFTAREGFLFINGHRVQYGSNLSFELNNGLNRVFAIFERDSISTSPLQLDITGSLNAYLIKGKSEDLFNMATGDKDVELVFCFQDQEDDPNYLYVMQIFKAKFTDTDISTGSEELEITLPFTSFEERACRMFRIRRKSIDVTLDADNSKIEITLADKPDSVTADDIKVTAKLDDGTVINIAYSSYEASTGVVTFNITDKYVTPCTFVVSAQYDGKIKTKSYVLSA